MSENWSRTRRCVRLCQPKQGACQPLSVEVEPLGAGPDAPVLASPLHTAALVCVILAVAITGTLLQYAGVPVASPGAHGSPTVTRIWAQYLPLLLVNGLLVLYVARLFRPSNALPQLLGRRWRGLADSAIDLLYAGVAFALIVALEALTGPLFAGRNAALSSLLPSTEAERLTWLLVAPVVGFCEEVVYRGYLLVQLSAFTRSAACGTRAPGTAVRAGASRAGSWCSFAHRRLRRAIGPAHAAWPKLARGDRLPHRHRSRQRPVALGLVLSQR